MPRKHEAMSPLELFRRDRNLSRRELARMSTNSWESSARAELAGEIAALEAGLSQGGHKLPSLWSFLRRAGVVDLEQAQGAWFNEQKPAVKIAAC